MSNWHTMANQEVLSSLSSALEGLTQTEAETRLEKNGPNELMEKEKDPLSGDFYRPIH